MPVRPTSTGEGKLKHRDNSRRKIAMIFAWMAARSLSTDSNHLKSAVEGFLSNVRAA
jgi:hypothetical protein